MAEIPMSQPIVSTRVFYTKYFKGNLPACEIDQRCRMMIDAIQKAKPDTYKMDDTYHKMRTIMTELRWELAS